MAIRRPLQNRRCFFCAPKLANNPASQLQAAADYQTIYLHFPLSDQAREAGAKLSFLRSSLGDKLARFHIEQQLDTLPRFSRRINGAIRATNIRACCRNLPARIANARNCASWNAAWRSAQAYPRCWRSRSAIPTWMPSATTRIANYYRDRPSEAQMIAAVESAVARAPHSRWAESALFLAGNYYWVQLDRDRAACFYQTPL